MRQGQILCDAVALPCGLQTAFQEARLNSLSQLIGSRCGLLGPWIEICIVRQWPLPVMYDLSHWWLICRKFAKGENSSKMVDVGRDDWESRSVSTQNNVQQLGVKCLFK